MSSPWPPLPLDAWRDTAETLHLWSQVVGKVRLALAPWVNHSWHVTFAVSARGLTSGAIPHGTRTFDMELDLVDHRLLIRTGEGEDGVVPLRPRTVADFHRAVLDELERLGLPVEIHGAPNELPEAIPFAEDHVHASYDPEAGHRFWRALVQSDRVLRRFRSGFLGKCSPVHFFWGSFDLAVTRFSGRPAPEHPGGIPHLPDEIVREAYSHEVSSAGFWPGGQPHPFPLFYSYAYPEPPGFADAPVRPDGAFYSRDLREFILPYDVVREAASPDDVLHEFLQSTYETAANLGGWDRPALERREP